MSVLSARHPLRLAADDALRAAGLRSRANSLVLSPTFGALSLNISGAATSLYDAMAVARAAGVDELVDPLCKRAARALDALGKEAATEEERHQPAKRVS
jgi:hypothetical protein